MMWNIEYVNMRGFDHTVPSDANEEPVEFLLDLLARGYEPYAISHEHGTVVHWLKKKIS